MRYEKTASDGPGWHGEKKRHSNARKYGRAGGTYALRGDTSQNKTSRWEPETPNQHHKLQTIGFDINNTRPEERPEGYPYWTFEAKRKRAISILDERDDLTHNEKEYILRWMELDWDRNKKIESQESEQLLPGDPFYRPPR